jgi:hypothetical protein
MTMAADIYLLLNAARKLYEGDAAGMADGGEMLSSDFEDYLPEYEKLQIANVGSKLTVENQIERFKNHFEM